jgi:hypothetical protein
MYSQRSVSPAPPNNYVADGQWHHFGPQSASPQTMPHAQGSEPVRTYNADVGDGQWHHFAPQPAPPMRAASPPAVPHTPASNPARTYNVSLAENR